MLLTKVTGAMKTRAQLDERSFEQLLAAAYMLAAGSASRYRSPPLAASLR